MSHFWRLDAGTQTLVLTSEDGDLPCVAHWGAPLPMDEDLVSLGAAVGRDVTGGMMDELPPLTLCPAEADSFAGQPGMVLYQGGAVLRPDFRLSHATQTGDELTFEYADTALGLSYRATFTADAKVGVIRCQSFLKSKSDVTCHWLAAPVLPGPQWGSDIIDVSGKWVSEFQLNRTQWSPGIHMRDARSGRSGHEHPPFALFTEPGTTNTRGAVWGAHYGWSGGHRMVAEELPDGRRQIQWGHASASCGTGQAFETAELFLTYSSDGLNGCADAFQRLFHDRIVTWPQPAKPRSVHYNCWEAVYFDHDLPTLKDIANRAADLGAERFVLDDGWFGKRDDDTTSLGDWQIDARKWPDGLTPLIDHVQSLGMGFGLWFEPEMISENSDLYRAHPDWVLGPMTQLRGRQQLVLNMALPEVRDYLFDRISAILSDNAIEYIKWDHNRLLPHTDAAQTHGIYVLLDRLRAAHPLVEIESCASGGGRIDAGILARTQRIWLSDSNDALERLRIQHDAALFLPASITGSHVGPRHCHTSGRVLDIRFRAWVAAQRHMGFEMDPRELTKVEATTLREVTAWWKANRDWRRDARILRLDAADPAVTAEIQIARDGHRFVVFVGQAESSSQITPRPIRLTGLNPEAMYEISLLTHDTPGFSRGAPALKNGPVTLSGQALMSGGFSLPFAFPQSLNVIEGRRL
ncbi:alpha-galactosidase [Actibacterium lipolyticum]|uniref:alpha-galactosidase n=1 Tax=Actibacterium lipolyticum TaxID=1524263 RepID=A0A238KJT2_9RHOB|nr:alpha-galactosidase [Actibacterium lipolyticum]SMX42917.1 Alpha-galactosidase [Actibacterium lipolyticum]